MVLKQLFFYVLSILVVNEICSEYNDLTLIGPVSFAESLGGVTTGIVSSLYKDLRINIIPTYAMEQDLPSYMKALIVPPNSPVGKVTVFTGLLWYHNVFESDLVKVDGKIKIAYSMLEASRIPPQWVKALNEKFDAVVVPENWLVKVYSDCGVNIPIFVIPCVAALEKILNSPIKSQKNNIFTFGTSASAISRKNIDQLIRAFNQEFGNVPNVQLKIHCRIGEAQVEKELINLLKKFKARNIELISKWFSRDEYIQFLTSLDCFVLLSKGEGFSLAPRDAMGLGIPSILSDNTAHSTLCNTGLVRKVRTHILEVAYYPIFRATCGYCFNCTLQDACLALRDVYSNYADYLKNNHASRKWVSQYTADSLRPFYLSLVKPKRVILGSYNKITTQYLMTNSKKLYNKYRI